jgi:hypothetical protein
MAGTSKPEYSALSRPSPSHAFRLFPTTPPRKREMSQQSDRASAEMELSGERYCPSPLSEAEEPLRGQHRHGRDVDIVTDDTQSHLGYHQILPNEALMAKAPSDSSLPPLFTNRRTSSKKPVIRWGWWWEIGALVLCLLSLALLLLLLASLHMSPFENWTLPILPNTLIGIFTTLLKTTMMVPIATCLSQLKWSHYFNHAQPLNHLQLYEEASRGPWGSAMILFFLRGKPVVASLFAFVTITALAIDPFAQQILETQSRRVELRNVTAEIGIARDYEPRSFVRGGICKFFIIIFCFYFYFLFLKKKGLSHPTFIYT